MTKFAFPLSLALAGALTACSPQAEQASGPETQASVVVADAWCRAAPAAAAAGGCYLTMTASGDDRLIAVETTSAERGEIHTMDMAGGVMRMRPLPDGIPLPAGEPVRLEPGARHLMIINPKQTLEAGGGVALTLRFETAPAIMIDAPIREASSGHGEH